MSYDITGCAELHYRYQRFMAWGILDLESELEKIYNGSSPATSELSGCEQFN